MILFVASYKKTNARILEIGCGPGNITKYILSKRPDFIIDAIDVSPSMIELAKINISGPEFEVMDCRNMKDIRTTYDAIMCGFCMPYLSKGDCKTLIENCSRLINTDGILYLSTIEGASAQTGFVVGSTGNRTYVYYHEKIYLQELLRGNNLELIEVSRKTYGKALEASSIHMIFIARKK